MPRLMNSNKLRRTFVIMMDLVKLDGCKMLQIGDLNFLLHSINSIKQGSFSRPPQDHLPKHRLPQMKIYFRIGVFYDFGAPRRIRNHLRFKRNNFQLLIKRNQPCQRKQRNERKQCNAKFLKGSTNISQLKSQFAVVNAIRRHLRINRFRSSS
jgi:hypothetical protein